MNYITVNMNLPLLREQGIPPVRIAIPADTLEQTKDLVDSAKELLIILSLNIKRYLVNKTILTIGAANTTLFDISQIFRQVILDDAWTCILVHNHPSGDLTPSLEDCRITKQLVAASKIIQITIDDHVIIGRNLQTRRPAYLSMRETGLVDFATV